MHSILTSRMLIRLRNYGHQTIRSKSLTIGSAFATLPGTREFKLAVDAIRTKADGEADEADDEDNEDVGGESSTYGEVLV